MKLVLPNKKYANDYFDLVKSAKKNKDISEMGNAYREGETFQEMIKRLKNRRAGINLVPREVPSSLYFIINDEDHLVGTIDLRHKLNGSYFSRLGHIAYYIKKEERNKRYATKALSLALKKYQLMHVDSILVTCLKENIPSRVVIEKNGGVLEKEFDDPITGGVIQRWWISVKEEENVTPSVAWLTTNRTCNNNCNWCYANTCKMKSAVMDLENISKCIDFFRENKIKKVVLIGGEPTIYQDIDKVIRMLNENKINVSMASNGRKFSDYTFAKKLVDCGLKSCNISIKGSNEEEYKKNTNSIGFYEMVSGYKNLKKLGIDVSLSYVLCNKNYKEFDRFLNSFLEQGLDNIVFQLYKPSVDGNDGSYLEPSIVDLADMCCYVFEKMEDLNKNFSFEMSIPLCSLDNELLKKMIARNCITTCCHLSHGKGIIFDTNFDILPCNHFVNHPLNNKRVEFSKLIDFWNSDDVCKFRNIINTYPSEICSRCSMWHLCGGGCFIRWLSEKPDNIINDKYVYIREEVR